VAASEEEGSDLEPLPPISLASPTIGPPKERTPPVAVVILGVVVAVLIGVLAWIGAPSSSARYCLSSPLAGQLIVTPGSMVAAVEEVRGHVAGFPANDYVQVDLLDSTVRPVHVIGTFSFSTNATGAQDVVEHTAVDPNTTASQIAFRVYSGPNNGLQPYGARAQQC